MYSQPGTIWGREPAMVLALVQAVIALVVAFGLQRTGGGVARGSELGAGLRRFPRKRTAIICNNSTAPVVLQVRRGPLGS